VRAFRDVQALFFSRHTKTTCESKMTQEAVTEIAAEVATKKETKQNAKVSVPVQTLVDSLKSAADDIGQISELSSEEKLLVAEFFKSLLNLMQPLTLSLPVTTSAIQNVGDVIQAHVDPTGHLAVLFGDGRLELKNLLDEKNRDLMMAVIEDIVPKFKNLTSAEKRKLENRIKVLSSVTKEMQKISETLTTISSSTS
jgi:hypothetical protein